MPLTGSLSTMPLSDLLQWLESVRKTGTLAIEGPEFTATLFLRDGLVISSASTDPRCYLGQFLLAYTSLSEEQLKIAFERQEATRVYLGKNIYIKTMLGKILVEAGLLAEEEIVRVLAIKVEETLYPAFDWKNGSFRFIDDELPPEEMVPLKLDLVHVINRGLQRLEEWRDIRARIPSNHWCFRVDGRRAAAARPDGLAQRILTQLASGATIHDAILSLRATEFATNRIVAGFLRDGVLQLDHEQATSTSPLWPAQDSPAPARGTATSPDLLVEAGEEKLLKRELAQTVILARQAVHDDPSHNHARELLERSERELTESFYASFFAPTDVLYLAQPRATVDATKRTPEERFLLDRVDRQWTVRSIAQLSPLKEVDALAILKKLVEEGIVGIRRKPR